MNFEKQAAELTVPAIFDMTTTVTPQFFMLYLFQGGVSLPIFEKVAYPPCPYIINEVFDSNIIFSKLMFLSYLP